jgi:glyoxylase-like metal-dependent hydrolase (beta-lactamase superfamily II)
MIFETLVLGPLGVNCYILASGRRKRAVIIDPGAEPRKIKRVLQRHELEPGIVINTHGHYDHIGCDDDFGVPVYIHKDDAASLKNPESNLSTLLMTAHRVDSEVKTVEEKELISLDGIVLEVIHTPGHTRGGISLLMKKPKSNILFSGDTLFCGGIGRADFPGASEGQLISSIKKKLLVLADDTQVYPGHGPASTIGAEKRSNPFFCF